MSIFRTVGNSTASRRATLNFVAGSLWLAPGSFGIARLLGTKYSLRSILFHHIADEESPFTKGIGVTVTRKQFEAALKFIKKNYTPVSLEEVIADPVDKSLPPRPVLVTFDDAYASVSEFAAPLCLQLGVPAVFFVNAACLDNRQIALENLICYLVNRSGLAIVNAAIRSINLNHDFQVHSLEEVFSQFLPSISLTSRAEFREAMRELSGISETELAAEAALYLSSEQLRRIVQFGFEIGNHTYSHVNCRILSRAELVKEIDRNKAVLDSISGTNIRSFSVPYGSLADLTREMAEHLRVSGYKAVFLAEGSANSSRKSTFTLDRVSLHATTDPALFSEIEVLPRLRTIRKRLEFWGIMKIRRSRLLFSNV